LQTPRAKTARPDVLILIDAALEIRPWVL
jgi:hypothetical protein